MKDRPPSDADDRRRRETERKRLMRLRRTILPPVPDIPRARLPKGTKWKEDVRDRFYRVMPRRVDDLRLAFQHLIDSVERGHQELTDSQAAIIIEVFRGYAEQTAETLQQKAKRDDIRVRHLVGEDSRDPASEGHSDPAPVAEKPARKRRAG